MSKIKLKCCKCDAFAVWCYMPASERPEEERYFCDEHISRGCSCQVIEYGSGGTEQYKDEQGRLLPCIEYDYDPNGYYDNDGDYWTREYEDWFPFEED